MKHHIKKNDAFYHERPGVKGWYYQLQNIDGDRSVIYGEVSGVHGRRVIGEKPRIYYIIEGEGEYTINDEKISVSSGDVVIIPPFGTYDFRPSSAVLKVVLFMNMLDLSKLPNK